MASKGRAHQRSLDRARRKRQLQRRQETRRRRLLLGGGGLIALLVAGTMVAALLPGATPPQISDPATTSPAPSDPPSSELAGVACDGSVPPAAEESKPQFDAPPEQALAEDADYRATLTTSCGDVVVDLYEDRAPTTVNNFVFLARQDFYDGVTFHRIVAGFVIQGGDPQGTGAGGPGYEFGDELEVAQSEGYRTGSLAMANSGPDTNGSQFFIVLEGGGSRLQPLYNLFGEVVSGMDVVERIASVPVSGQAPLQQVYIEDVTIEELAGPAGVSPQPTPGGSS